MGVRGALLLVTGQDTVAPLANCLIAHPPAHPPSLALAPTAPRHATPRHARLPCRPLPGAGDAAAGPRGGVARPGRRADVCGGGRAVLQPRTHAGPAGGAGRAAAVPGRHEHHHLCQPQVGWVGGRVGGWMGGWAGHVAWCGMGLWCGAGLALCSAGVWLWDYPHTTPSCGLPR